MRKFKTAEDNRTNYIYYFNDGTSYTITPGENGENATIISQLHGMDDDGKIHRWIANMFVSLIGLAENPTSD